MFHEAVLMTMHTDRVMDGGETAVETAIMEFSPL